MGLALLVTLPVLLAAEPTVSVVLSRRTAVSPAEAAGVTAQVATALTTAKVPTLTTAETAQRLARVGQKDATLCAGKKECLKELLTSLEVRYLLLVSVAKVAGDKGLAMELYDGLTATVVDSESLVLPTWKSAKPELLQGFAARVLAKVQPPPPPVEPKPVEPAKDPPPEVKPPDAPVATNLTPPPPVEQPPVAPPPPPPRSHAGGIVLGALGVAALAAGGVLLGLGLSNVNSLSQGAVQPDGTVHSELRGSEAQQRAQTATVQLGIAGGAAAAALGFGTAAIIAW